MFDNTNNRITDEDIVYADIKDGVVVAYYSKAIHYDDIPTSAIKITAELHYELLQMTRVGFQNISLASESEGVMGIESIGRFIDLGYEQLPENLTISEEDKKIKQLEEENQLLKLRLEAIEKKLGL